MSSKWLYISIFISTGIYLATTLSCAEDFELKSGKIFSGKVISRDDENIRLETNDGILVIPRIMLATPKEKQKTAEDAQSAQTPSTPDIQYLVISLYAGMDGHTYGLNKKTLNLIQKEASEVNLDVSKLLQEQCVYRQVGDKFFIVFYNQVRATGCPRKYLIQRVLLEKEHSGGSNGFRSKREYLVEVMKLNNEGRLKRADEHYKTYSLGSASRRFTKVSLQIGCGEIPGVAEGNAWPFDNDILYKGIQDYAEQPGLYNKIDFDFSSTYQFSFEFSKQGRPHVNVPGYTCREY